MTPRTAALIASVSLVLPVSAQKAGDTMGPGALAKLDWIQGAAPAEWEPGKLYILECWATWCGPCIAAIPHVDALHDKYHEKGLRVIGVNVWEDGREKVAKFVGNKGDGMSYPVAYTGKGGAFETEWLDPAGVTGIPNAFVVLDGKVLFSTHPQKLNDEVIEQLLSGPEGVAKATAAMAASGENKGGALNELGRKFVAASRAKDIAGMKEAVEGMRAIPQAAPAIPRMELDIALAAGDWKAAAALLETLKGEDAYVMILSKTAQRISSESSDASEEFRREIAGALGEITAKPHSHPLLLTQLARLQWVLGEKQAAIASADRQVELLKSPEAARYKMPAGPSEKFAAALREGRLPEESEFFGWMRESRTGAMPMGAAGVKEKQEN